MTSPSEYISGLTIGTVERVSAGSITVRLLEDAPHGTALNSGVLTRFPRINAPLVIPSEYGSILGLTVEVVVERLRDDPRDELVRMAVPTRRIILLPIGTVKPSETGYRLERGIPVFPTVGDPVLIPTASELGALSQASEGPTSIDIGRSVLATRAPVLVDMDRMLSRHLAVLGNTGSGKSCSVAVVLRAAITATRPSEESSDDVDPVPRVVVLDTNGEYSHAFDGLPINVRRFAVESDAEENSEQLRVPGWLWNSTEWVAFTGASSGAQAPYIRRSLALLRSHAHIADDRKRRTAVILSTIDLKVRRIIRIGPGSDFRDRQDQGRIIDVLRDNYRHLITEQKDDLDRVLEDLGSECSDVEESYFDGQYWNSIPLEHWERLGSLLADALGLCVPDDDGRIVHEDDPIPFDVRLLADLIELEALEESTGSAIGWVAPLLFRLRGLLNDRQVALLAGASSHNQDDNLANWLDQMLSPGQVTVIDLSLVPAPVLHLTVAVLTRVIFEAHQRYRRINRNVFPTVLVAEEAHRFLHKRGPGSADSPTMASELCVQSFERIAREGRKLGLSLVLTSQRPSELSETVLSQCNTFLVHRVVNDVDQALIRRLVPDSLGSLVDELPALPARTAVLMGWASEVPMMIEVAELDSAYRPSSEDPLILEEWSSPSSSTSWSDVVERWERDEE